MPFRRFPRSRHFGARRSKRRKVLWKSLHFVGDTIAGNTAKAYTLDTNVTVSEKSGATVVRIIGNLQVALTAPGASTGQVMFGIYMATNDEDASSAFPDPALETGLDGEFLWWFNLQPEPYAVATGAVQLQFRNFPVDIRVKRKYKNDDNILKFLAATPVAGNANTITFGFTGRFLIALS